MRIQAIDVENAGKLTGMLLELDNTELINLLEDPQVRHAKIQEAKEVLQAATLTETYEN